MDKSIFYFVIFSCCFFYSCDGVGQWNNIYVESAWEERDTWQRADEIIDYMNLDSNSQVADVGCHQGYMTVKLAEKVKSGGKVFAVDVDQYKLDQLQRIVNERGFTDEVKVIKGEYDNPKLPENTLDAVIIMDTYHEIDQHMKVLGKVLLSLKPGGLLLILEPIADERLNSSRKEQERKHEIASKYVEKDVRKAGFEIVEKIDPFIDRTKEKGDKMWLILCRRPYL